MKPSDYKHIAAWCRANGISDKDRRQKQAEAARLSAPIEAVYRYWDGLTHRWATYSTVGHATQRALEVELNRGGKRAPQKASHRS